jgi:hypothetical protein
VVVRHPLGLLPPRLRMTRMMMTIPLIYHSTNERP